MFSVRKGKVLCLESLQISIWHLVDVKSSRFDHVSLSLSQCKLVRPVIARLSRARRCNHSLRIH